MERGGGWASIDNRIVLRIEKSQNMKGMRPWSRQETGWREKRRGERGGGTDGERIRGHEENDAMKL